MLVLFCPSCSAGLQLPRSVLATRARRICCAICEHRWIEAPVLDQERRDDHAAAVGPELALHAENVRSEGAAGENPQEDLKVAVDPATPLVGAPPRPAHRPRVARRRPGRPHPLQDALPRTWPRVAAGVGVMAMLMLGLARREDIVRVAPSLAGAYAAIGLPVNIHGLEWREVRTSLVTDASQKVLAVEGEIRNLRSQSQTLPDIQLSLRDSNGREVYAWKTPAPKADLGGGESIPFRARLASPPGAATAVRVVFAEAKTDRLIP